jgi:YHS domain-containing protein
MMIAEQDAQASRHIGGMQVYFCSAACVHQFDAEPQRFYPPLGGSPTSQVALVSTSARPIQAPITVGPSRALLRPVMFGLLAILGLLAFYLGIITLAQGWGQDFNVAPESSGHDSQH